MINHSEVQTFLRNGKSISEETGGKPGDFKYRYGRSRAGLSAHKDKETEIPPLCNPRSARYCRLCVALATALPLLRKLTTQNSQRVDLKKWKQPHTSRRVNFYCGTQRSMAVLSQHKYASSAAGPRAPQHNPPACPRNARAPGPIPLAPCYKSSLKIRLRSPFWPPKTHTWSIHPEIGGVYMVLKTFRRTLSPPPPL